MFPGRVFSGLDQMVICMNYSDSAIFRKLLFQFKYSFCHEIAEILGKIAVKGLVFLDGDVADVEILLIIPSPMHINREKQRGYNHVMILAEMIAKLRGIEVCNCLYRKENIPQQMKLNRNERLKNLRGKIGFFDKFRSQIYGKKILFLDDVATTGSTIFECARVLKKNGADSVSALVLAKDGHLW